MSCGPQDKYRAKDKKRGEPTKPHQEVFGTMGWCILSGLGLALMCGVGKLVIDFQKSQLQPRRKMPWELD